MHIPINGIDLGEAMKTSNRGLLLMGVTLCALGLAPSVQAQTPGAAPAASAPTADPTSLDEIIVTANRREENLQKASLSIEALSRGAAGAVLVERDRRVARVAEANLEALGAAGDAEVLCSPAGAAADRLAGEGREFDLVFLDPPYAEARELLAGLAPALGEITAPGGRIVVESDRRDAPGLDLPMVHERRYGDTTIRIFSARE
jgi:hypothetical protein